MKPTLLQWLRCPQCQGSFEVRPFLERDHSGIRHLQDGALLCTQCHRYFYVSQFIPRLLVGDYADVDFARRYRPELVEIERTHTLAYGEQNREMVRLQNLTRRNFGFEWQEWGDFGWQGEKPSKTTCDIFDYKVLATPTELQGKLVLDAGCGNGRYTAVARAYGGTTIGIDLSGAVDIAYDHLGQDPNVHIVQGDLHHLPFIPGTFDFIFSNGVLMHTGDAHRAFLSLASRLNDHGAITVHLYHKGNFIYEFNDWWLRVVFTRVPLSWAFVFAKFWAWLAGVLPKFFVMNVLNGFVRIEPHPHYVFDWYTAPIATHHTYPELYGWLKEAGLHLAADHNATNKPFLRKIFPFLFLTVKAQRLAMTTPPAHTRT